ncbi:hypothetical protein J3R30DRAFT_3295641 [Lentinula aciculospora]|uniref:Uncharacterized protein n=1 Tax=Lentinula aciculospora TaxID=153920 RepID=A0A9W9A751_9AGAR|nr:hypothetical protein J3R30DRAFT_3295641 [Lentinula aciculospora]
MDSYSEKLHNPNNDPPFSASGWTDATVTVEFPRQQFLPGQLIPKNEPTKIHDFLCRELAVPRLNDIHRYLWIAGWQESIHPLHWHLMVRRSIIITEDPDMHLICTDWAIFVKPLPVCLLCYDDYYQYISNHDSLSLAARGFLRSYARLLVHESDFLLAKQHNLLPQAMKWVDWRPLAQELELISSESVNKRYRYGELRLARLNWICRVWRGRLMYFRLYRSYTAYFSNQFRSPLVLFAYTTIIHAALQTMLNVEGFPMSVKMLYQLSFWFGAITIICVVFSGLLQVVYFVMALLYNLQATLRAPKRFKSD